jgi:hypothetical protein
MRTAEEERLEVELRELAEMYPPVDLAEYWEDWYWLGRQPLLRADWPYWNVNVAALNKEIIGTGPDYRELRLRLAREHHVHPNRIVVDYFGDDY